MSSLPPRAWLGYLCLALSMSLVGCYVALSKPLMLSFPVLLLAWMRFGLGGVAMLPWLRKPADELPMTASIQRLVFLESFLGNFLFSICMLYGVRLTSAISASVIMAAIPAAVALLSWIFLRERITWRVALAIACAAFGIGLLALAKPESTGEAHGNSKEGVAMGKAALGNLLIVCAVLCEAAYAVIGKTLTKQLSPKRISALINLWGFALVTPMGAYLAWQFDFAAVALSQWLLLCFYALAASVWTVWLWMTGLKSVPASQAGVFTVMLPISAALVGLFVLHEPLSQLQIYAFALAVIGLILATGAEKP